jgi:8-oxo-dGTP pyrophosphatase MutT (NUDIX family)
MTPLSLRERIRHRLNAHYETGFITGDFAVAGVEREQRTLRLASVLIGLVERNEGATVLLTQRTDHLIHHPGQVSFPGGGVEEADDDPVATALRESEEEIGLDRRHVDVAGFLDRYQTVTGFLVTPVVAFIAPPFELRPDPFEVAEVFEIPLRFVLDPRNHERRSMLFNGRQRTFYVLPYQNHYIWGATAAMLVNLHSKLGSLTD